MGGGNYMKLNFEIEKKDDDTFSVQLTAKNGICRNFNLDTAEEVLRMINETLQEDFDLSAHIPF